MRRDTDSGIPTPTVLIAARNAGPILKKKADWVVGEPQTEGFKAKLRSVNENGGKILLSEGTFDVEETS